MYSEPTSEFAPLSAPGQWNVTNWWQRRWRTKLQTEESDSDLSLSLYLQHSPWHWYPCFPNPLPLHQHHLRIRRRIYSPYEVLTVAAEGWMLEKSRDEFVLLDLRDVLLLESSLSSPSFSRQGHVFLQSLPLYFIYKTNVLKPLLEPFCLICSEKFKASSPNATDE